MEPYPGLTTRFRKLGGFGMILPIQPLFSWANLHYSENLTAARALTVCGGYLMAIPAGSEAQAAALARFDDEWTKTSVSSNDVYSDIPDGPYDAVIEEARLSETVSTGRQMVIWKLRIQAPDGTRVVTQTRVITENTIAWL